MKYLFKVFCILSVLLISMSARAGDYVASLDISGTTTALNQDVTYSGTSWYSTIDILAIRPLHKVFSVQVTEVDLAASNQDNTILTSDNGSGATYYLVYTVSNKDDDDLWAGSGVTEICGPIALSGATPVVQPFIPETAKYLKVGVISGMTQFNTFKATLAIY